MKVRTSGVTNRLMTTSPSHLQCKTVEVTPRNSLTSHVTVRCMLVADRTVQRARVLCSLLRSCRLQQNVEDSSLQAEMGRACSLGLRQLTFLLTLVSLGSVASATGHTQDHIKLHLYEVPAPDTWPVTLQCDVEQPSAHPSPCSGPHWSQQDSHVGHTTNGINPVPDVTGISTSDVTETSHVHFGISTGDNVSYQVQTNSLRITSRVRILQPAEPHEERYVCSVVCGLDTYIVSCTVIALSQNNRTVLCSQEKFLDLDVGSTDPGGPGNTTLRHSARPTTSSRTTERLSGLDDEEKTGPSVVTIVWFTLAVIFFISFLMVIRWSLKHGQTLKDLNRRYFRHVTRFLGLRCAHGDQTSDVNHPSSEQHCSHRSYVVHPVSSPSSQDETNDESSVLLGGYTSEVAVSGNSRHPAASTWALRHVYASRDASSMVRCSEWSRQTPTLSRTIGGGAQASVVDVVVSFDELVSPSQPLLLRPAISRAVPCGHGDVIVQELSNGDRLIYIPAVSLPSYDDVMTESRREAREGLSSLTDSPSHQTSSARGEESSSSLSSTSSLSRGESFELMERLDTRVPSAFLQRPLPVYSPRLPPPPYMVRDTGREALASSGNLQTPGSVEASVVSGNCRDWSRPPSYVSILDVEDACTASAAVPTVERQGAECEV